MGINLREMIEGEIIADTEVFAGAVALTYTLNLNFYEQIVAPSIDRAGVANVLIIADPDGYAGAMEMGARSVTGAGMRYVCTPLIRRNKGILHAKAILMAGPHHGRLFIGSGNLTMYGIGRNLELFSFFQFNSSNPTVEDHYAFVTTWKLLAHLKQRNLMSRTAQRQLGELSEKAPWLLHDVAESPSFRIWNNLEESFWNQLLRWRKENNLDKPLRALLVISPYYDEDVSTLKHIVDSLTPSTISVHVDPNATNLQGKMLKKTLGKSSRKLVVNTVRAKDSKHNRHLHAKAIIGIEDRGAWCLAGSANLTRPAITKSWAQGGNLELVTFRWISDRTAFDYLLKDHAIRIREIEIDEIVGQEDEPSDIIATSETSFMLTELSAKGRILEGKLSDLPVDSSTGKLQLLKTGEEFLVSIDASFDFRVNLPNPLGQAEAARLKIGSHFTPYRWIDQPEELARFGARTYHAQIKAKLETFDGAGKLFQELMDFLWARLEPEKNSVADQQERAARARRHVNAHGEHEDEPPPPPPADFISESDLLDHINNRIDYHQPFERSTYSLRDLFSLVLLRLTAEAKSPEAVTENGNIDEESIQQGVAEQEEKRINIQQYLCDYIKKYCKRYGQRLGNAEFVKQIDPRRLFENHFTLGRILLEFADKVSEFTASDLKACFWWVWAPLVWPDIIELSGKPVLKSLNELYQDNVLGHWRDSGLPSMSVLMITRAFGSPPNLKVSAWDIGRVQGYMTVREFIEKMKGQLGPRAFESIPEDPCHSQGIPSEVGSSNFDQLPSIEDSHTTTAMFNDLASYVSPPERWYGSLRELQALELDGLGQSERADLIAFAFKENGLESLLEYRSSRMPIRPIPWGKKFCPKCFIQQTIKNLNQLAEGELVLCSSSKDALIYWQPVLPKSILQNIKRD
ncbi:MAG: hypothetical protein M1282_06570 [Chloroflexi bacterium]|nr:hypothetical protein [Chloroflexota bacterium]